MAMCAGQRVTSHNPRIAQNSDPLTRAEPFGSHAIFRRDCEWTQQFWRGLQTRTDHADLLSPSNRAPVRTCAK
jgi:hypothetical protein